MPQDKKKSIKEFADEIRMNADVPEGTSDEDLVRQVVEAVPEALSQIQTSERRPFMKPEGGATGRFLKGMGSIVPDTIEGIKNMPAASKPRGNEPDLGATMGGAGNIALLMKHMAEGIKNSPGSLVDMPNIKKDREHNNDAGAAGRSLTQGILVSTGLQGLLSKTGVLSKTAGAAKGAEALGEMEAIGAETTKDAGLAIAKRVSKPQAALLDKGIADISKAMEHQYISSKSLSAGIAYAKKVIEKVSKAPGAQVKDVSAAKEAIMRLDAKIKANPNIIPWNDAREMAKELDQAKKTLGPSAARNAVGEVSDALKAEVTTSAEKAGQGASYAKWTKDYASLSKWQRAYSKIIGRQTQLQKETQLTAKDGFSVGVPKTNLKLRLGKARTDKIAEANKTMIDKAHKGLEELHNQINSQPKGTTPPPAAAPTAGQPPVQPAPQPAPQGGTPMPKPQAAAPPQGQPMQGAKPPVAQDWGAAAMKGAPPIAPGQLGPMQQRILEELKKMGGGGQVAPPPQS